MMHLAIIARGEREKEMGKVFFGVLITRNRSPLGNDYSGGISQTTK